MNGFLNSPMFGILLSLLAFEIGLYIQKKTKLLFLNPLMIAIIIIILLLLITKIDIRQYQVGGDIINMFLGPATVVLAVPLYQQIHSLKNYFVPIILGILIGIVTGLVSTMLCCILAKFEPQIIASLLPKSITTPIGMEVSSQLGGVQAITVLTILVTGIFGAVIADIVFKVFKIQHPIARGISLGTSAHAIGTTKALQLGKIEGAMSSLAIGVSGVATVFLAPMVWQFVAVYVL